MYSVWAYKGQWVIKIKKQSASYYNIYSQPRISRTIYIYIYVCVCITLLFWVTTVWSSSNKHKMLLLLQNYMPFLLKLGARNSFLYMPSFISIKFDDMCLEMMQLCNISNDYFLLARLGCLFYVKLLVSNIILINIY